MISEIRKRLSEIQHQLQILDCLVLEYTALMHIREYHAELRAILKSVQALAERMDEHQIAQSVREFNRAQPKIEFSRFGEI